jgi:hypothetical protein
MQWHELVFQVQRKIRIFRRAEGQPALGAVGLPHKKQVEDLLSGRFGTDNFVALDDRGDADSAGTIFRFPVDSNHFAHRPNENFRTSGHFGGQSERYVKLGSRAHILVNGKVNAACGNVAGLPVARGKLFLNWYPNNDRQRQVISTRGSTLRHLFFPRTLVFCTITPPTTKEWSNWLSKAADRFTIQPEFRQPSKTNGTPNAPF